MSPIFETERDRQNERAVIERYCNQIGVGFSITDTLAPYDFVAYVDDDPVAIGEVKCRSVKHDQYGGWMYFDAEKLQKLLGEARRQGNLIPILLLSYSDGTFYVNGHEAARCRTVQSRRTDRGDADRLQEAHVIDPRHARRLW